jgi:hypothetical protein
MSAYKPSSSLGNFVPENIDLTKSYEDNRSQLQQYLQQNARVTNTKESAIYELVERICGVKFFTSNPQDFVETYRKVITIGQLPDTNIKTVNHNISNVDNTWMFTKIQGFARAPTIKPVWIPIPDTGPLYPIEVWVTDTVVGVQTGANLTNFTESYVILEYTKTWT